MPGAVIGDADQPVFDAAVGTMPFLDAQQAAVACIMREIGVIDGAARLARGERKPAPVGEAAVNALVAIVDEPQGAACRRQCAAAIAVDRRPHVGRVGAIRAVDRDPLPGRIGREPVERRAGHRGFDRGGGQRGGRLRCQAHVSGS